MKNSYSQMSVEESEGPLIIKFGYMCINKHPIPSYVAILAFVYSYFQSFGIFVKSARLFLLSDHEGLSEVYYWVSKLCILSDFLNFETVNGFTIFMWLSSLMHTFKVLFVVSFMIYKLKKKQIIPDLIKMDWGITCYFQPFVNFLPCHSLCIEVFRLFSKGKLGLFHDSGLNSAAFALTILIFIVNLLSSSAIIFLFFTIVKTQDPLSLKDSFPRAAEYMTKLVVPLIWLFADQSMWIQICLFAFFFIKSISTSSYSYYTLPFYRIKVIKLMTGAHAIIAPFTGAMLTTILLEKLNDMKYGLVFSTIVFIVFLPIAFKFNFTFLEFLFQYIYTTDAKDLNRHHIMHKDTVYHYFRKARKEPNEKKRTFDEKYMSYKVLSKLKDIDMSDSKELRTLVRRDLETGCKRFPNSIRMKLLLANHFVRHEECYLHAYSLIKDVNKNAASLSCQITINFLYLELHNRLVQKYGSAESSGNKTSDLNMLKFIELQGMDKEMREIIIQQLTFQTRFWKNFISSEPDMAFLIGMAQKASEKRNKILKFWRNFQKINDNNFRTPLLVFGVYSFIANNGLDAYAHITKYYNNAQKFKRIHQKNELTNETIFSADNVQIKMSANRSKLGKILDVSQNFEGVFGFERNLTLGRNITLIMPPYFKDKHDSFLLKHYNTGNSAITNRTLILPCFTARNFVFPMWVHIKMNPVINEDVSYFGVMRPVKAHTRTILIREDGVIDGMSENFSRDMNIDNVYGDPTWRIFKLCPDFKRINDAYNKMAYRQIEASGAREERNSMTLMTLGNRPASIKSRKPQKSIGNITNNNESKLTDRPLLNQTMDLESSRFPAGDTSRLNETRAGFDFDTIKSTERRSEITRTMRFKDPDALFSPTLRLVDPYVSEDLDEDEAEAIFEDHVNREFELVFYPRVEGPKHLEGDKANPIIYKAKLFMQVHGVQFIKQLILEKIYNREEYDMASKRSSQLDLKSAADLSSQGGDFDKPSPKPKGSILSSLIANRLKKNQEVPQLKIQAAAKDQTENLLSPRFAASRSRERFGSVSSANLSDEGSRDHIDMNYIDKNRSDTKSNYLGSRSPRSPQNMMDKSKIDDFRSLPSSDFNNTGRLQYLRHVDLESSQVLEDNEKSFREEKAKDKLKKTLKDKKLIGQQILLNGVALILKEEKLVKSEDIENFLDNQLKEFKGKLDKRMVDIGVAAEGSVSSSISSKGKRLQIRINEILALRTPQNHMKIFKAFFFFFIAIGLVFLISETVQSLVAITVIETRSKVIQAGLLRVDTLIKLTRQTRILQSIVRNKFVLSGIYTVDINIIKQSTEFQLDRMENYTRELLNAIGDIDDSYISTFFISDVNLYERDLNQILYLSETSDPFQAIANLIYRGRRFGRRTFPSVYIPGIDDADMTYVADNALNDLMISCESSVKILYEALDSDSDLAKKNLLAFLITALVLISSYAGAAIYSYLKTLKESTSFMNVIFRISPQEAQNIETMLTGYLNCLKNNAQEFELIKWFNDHEDVNLSSTQGQTKRLTNRKASLAKLHLRYTIFFAALIPAFLYMGAWMVFYYIESTDSIKIMLVQQTEINNALQTTYRQSMLDTLIVQIVYTNFTATVRNQNVEIVFNEVLEETPNFGKVIDGFRDKNGQLSAINQEIFFNFSCANMRASNLDSITTDDLKSSCNQISETTGYVSLSKISASIYAIMKNLMNILTTSPRTQENLDRTFLIGAETIPNNVDVYRALFGYLYEATLDDFNEKLDSTKKTIYVIAGVFAVMTTLVGILTYFVTINRIMSIEMEKKNTFALVPFKILLNNRFLKAHLVEISSGKLDNIKHIL